MDVATFGATSSPCSAQFVKNCNANEYASLYPEAASAIIDKHYVDDYFDSADTIEEAVERANQVKFIHSKGGFEMRNWVSNSPEVLRCMGERNAIQSIHFNRDKETESERVLGIIWNPMQDVFSFSTKHRENLEVYLNGSVRPTKRIALSAVMGFFDPLGLLGIFTIHGRILVQNLWRTGCEWDEEIDDHSWTKWKQWTSLLADVEAVRIHRCYIGDFVLSAVESMDLHIFVDASEFAFGSVAYFRVVTHGVVRCSLVMSRSKVAPLKKQSIHRLELMAAVLGARMQQAILTNHTYKVQRTFLWTDSKTVLSWIRSDQHNYKQFVAFRVGEILELTKLANWFWIPSKINVADTLTKWGQGPPLESNSQWFKGPNFLYETENSWPSRNLPPLNTDEERKAHVLHHDVVVTEPVIDVQRISNWNRLVRIVAQVERFISNLRRKKEGLAVHTVKATNKQQSLIITWAKMRAIKQPLQMAEFQKAESTLWKMAQNEGFYDEMRVLNKNLEKAPDASLEKIACSSVLYKLTPMLDEQGVMRMRGRMEKPGFIPSQPCHHNVPQQSVAGYS
ncbi:uncharacterized protein LOC129772895 [Toxorhynchites rutilus septentrionalis]|uniref:uncharacterized protein LOC129772895 n=1 Tax=Toxorhynchites rutilus septentrionalis TaxID=329112 RepID=UPI002479D5D6|nr:uncharacterized protein LOC129772895 [Toxorhynchites rutilus septentrionalis]